MLSHFFSTVLFEVRLVIDTPITCVLTSLALSNCPLFFLLFSSHLTLWQSKNHLNRNQNSLKISRESEESTVGAHRTTSMVQIYIFDLMLSKYHQSARFYPPIISTSIDIFLSFSPNTYIHIYTHTQTPYANINTHIHIHTYIHIHTIHTYIQYIHTYNT